MADDDSLDGGAKDRPFYVQKAYVAAFGSYDESAWDASRGFAANRARIVQVYDYYRTLYLKAPDLFLWAGLGRMAGGAVVGGMDFLLGMPAMGESVLTQTMVEIGKAIFDDLTWFHEAYLDDPSLLPALAATYDSESPAACSYAQAWSDILSGDAARVVQGNAALLQNEQQTIIQPRYDRIAASPELFTPVTFRRTRAFTGIVHPYHRDFLTSLPQGDVITFADRWQWITMPDGMWAKWAVMPTVAADERTRLVSLDFSDLLSQSFGPTVDALLPVGADDQ